MNLGLSQTDRELLFQLLIDPLKKQGAKVWIFGSRARGDYKKFSDIDILYDLQKNKKLPQGWMSPIIEAIENSNLPYKVDIVNRQEVAESYRDQVEAEKLEL